MIDSGPEWQRLSELARRSGKTALHELFDGQPARFSEFSLRSGNVLFDYSKNLITADIRTALLDLARAAGLEQAREALFSGANVNFTEARPALHHVCRGLLKTELEPVATAFDSEQARCEKLVKDFHANRFTGASGRPFRDIINVGIGGSELGPHLVVDALSPLVDKSRQFHFVSDIDHTHLTQLLAQLNPESTLVIIASKSFRTRETLSNARQIRDWMSASLSGEELSGQLIGISADPRAMTNFGISESLQFRIDPAVGGRFSLWSPVGLIARLAIGNDAFGELLKGAHDQDRHFLESDLETNLPVIMALVTLWNVNFRDINSLVTLPYHQRLGKLPDYLQQLEMESNGKSYTRTGEKAAYTTCPSVFGHIGLNAQHAFLQQLHQGTGEAYVEFLAVAKGNRPLEEDFLLASCLAQSRALLLGTHPKDAVEGDYDFKHCEGNRPSSTLLLDDLSPFTLGQLIALYEHRVFVMSVIWGINAFDQWGVELGKKLNQQLTGILEDEQASIAELDDSTRGLILAIRSARQ